MKTEGWITMAVLIGFGALALVITGLASNSWINYTVSRTQIKESFAPEATADFYKYLAYVTRTRGLFRVCVVNAEDTDVAAILATDYYKDKVLPGTENCIEETGYEVPQDVNTINYGEQYEIRIHLMRFQISITIIYAALTGITLAMAMIASILKKDALIKPLAYATSITLALGTISVVLFHVVIFYESSDVNVNPFKKYYIYQYNMVSFSSESFGWSYMVFCAGVAMTLLGSLCCYVAYYKQSAEERERLDFDEKKEKILSSMMSKSSFAEQKSQYASAKSLQNYGYY